MHQSQKVLLFLGNVSNVHESVKLPKLDTFFLLTVKVPGMDKNNEHWIMIKH